MLFTSNRKTVISLDFERTQTCKELCSYCYVGTTERIYKNYLPKITNNYNLALNDAEKFAKDLNSEYWKIRKSKSKLRNRLEKLPVRIYGSGDFIPGHLKFLQNLSFKHYLISKNLTNKAYNKFLIKLLKINNLTSIVLSFDSNNLDNYDNVKAYFKQDRVKFSFTGTTEELKLAKAKGLKFNIFFNTQKAKKFLLEARTHNEQCPCDTKLISSDDACTRCNKCWKSSVSKDI